MATMENSNLSSTPIVAQSGRPPDLAAAVLAINGSMVSTPVMITQAGLLDDNMDTDAEIAVRTDLKVSPRPSFRDMVVGRSLVVQKDNFICELDVDLIDDDFVDACGVGNQNSTEGIDRRQHQPSVDDRFGLWMQVVNRRRRPSMLRKVVNQDISVATGGSRFNVLNVEDGDNHQSQFLVPQRETNIEPRPIVTPSKDPNLVVSSSHFVLQHRNVAVVQKQMDVGDCEVFAIDKPVVGVSNSMERDTRNGGVQWIENSAFEGGSRPPQ
ncbi:hypothetical protein V6N13_074721 [Hibiscus sabdariffa]